ncbi:hypothetical protein [Deinococcus sp.]|uniref:hypothetical protein n=1 Tax=Deinococcus sp. TaxID=47478 RepID=UPI0025CFAA64|nr:hypothetical protein [Deinococcus sp.]
MSVASVIVGCLAALGLLLGLIPFFGWTNWFITLPLGIVGLVVAAIGNSRPGLILCGVVLLLAGLRLMLGGGII